MAQPGQTVVVVQQPGFGDNPAQTTCPNCQNNIISVTEKQNGTLSYLMAVIVCLLCCPCFWIPLVVDTCKDTVHTCPSCKAHLGVKKAM
ncbi:lipopolysaccharide-induced tumor necrosis factor-alpha factor homolog [Tachypleus tridentatus]|uniref:lipopolysaccharide-induced tumor necrosis factor-alpha factor homolog n=1 Tax=Tachypleus tridentatus TaxID=6853 RepID=UPI003FD1F208